ncbi:MAG: T9SS type A sorting domain-containing protein [Bacteroidota bacterium]|nr:T9SS type A sorting domain-containing protein [Bacteroidota bacterium]
MYPNPVKDHLRIRSEKRIDLVIVRNLMGQTVKTVSVNNLEATLDLSQVPVGSYLITLKLADGRLSTEKIVKL